MNTRCYVIATCRECRQIAISTSVDDRAELVKPRLIIQPGCNCAFPQFDLEYRSPYGAGRMSP